MSWLYRGADVVMEANPSESVLRALVDTAVAWQRAGVRPTVAEMLMLSTVEREAWLCAGQKLAADEVADEPTPDEIVHDLLTNWDAV